MTGSVGEHKTRYQHNNVTAWYCIARRRLRITRDEVTDKAASEDSFLGAGRNTSLSAFQGRGGV